MSILRRIEKTLDQRLRSIFGSSQSQDPEAREAIELYRDALDQVSARAQLGRKGERIFPFNRVTVELLAANPERKVMLETLFDAGQLSDDVRAALKEERIEVPADLAVYVHFSPDALVEMRVVCEKSAAPAVETAAVPVATVTPMKAKLVTVAGVGSQQEYPLTAHRLNIGREPEVLDTLGRLIRRNELHYPETAHPANASVSRSHAHIALDLSTGEWRIFDDGSSLGTSLFRDGHRIEIPAHGARGLLLRAGDDIYLGQVRLRFEVA